MLCLLFSSAFRSYIQGMMRISSNYGNISLIDDSRFGFVVLLPASSRERAVIEAFFW